MKTVTREQFAQMYGQNTLNKFTPLAPAPQQPTSLIERAGQFVSDHNLPGSKIGENIGTAYAALKANAQGNYEGAQAIANSGPSDTQVIGDVARSAAIPVSFMAPNPATLGGAVAQFGALGAVSGAGQAATENRNVARGALVGGAIGAAGGIFSKILEKGIAALGRATNATGEKITTTIIKPTKTDLEDGFNVDTIKKYNLGGSLQTMQAKTDAALDDLSRQVNEKYANSTSRININDILDKTIKQSAGSKVNTFGSNTSLSTAFNQLKGEVAAVSEDGTVSVPEAVQIKRAAGNLGAWVYGQNDPDSTARQKVYTAFYRQLKTAIEENSPPGVKELNKQLSDLIPVQNAIIRRIPVAQRNSTLSLTDIISLSASALDPRSLSVFALNQLSKSGVAAKALMNAGPAIEKGAAAFTPALRATSTALPQALESTIDPALQSTTQSTSNQPITEEQARKAVEMSQNFGPGGAALGVKKVGLAATDILKDGLIGMLEKGAPKINQFIDTKLTSEATDLIQYLKEQKTPDQKVINRALEVAKLQGHDVKTLVNTAIEEAQGQVQQLRDAFGRWIKEK